MPVVMIQNGIPLQANQVYVAPTHTHVSLEHGEFHATQVDTLEEQGVAIDFLFESLAEENGPYAIGILLSGAVHQALISVASEVGQGTTFTIALPAGTPSNKVEMSETHGCCGTELALFKTVWELILTLYGSTIPAVHVK
jgi:two-component system CheB/CheR fusion protein